MDCEQRRFGDALDSVELRSTATDGVESRSRDDRCVCCDRAGHYLLPVYYIDLTTHDSGWLGRAAPRLCFDHLFDLTSPEDLSRRRRRGPSWHRP